MYKKILVLCFAVMVLLSLGIDLVVATDADGDGIDDSLDNCILEYNPDQADADGDGYGNLCDADFNNDCIVNMTDLDMLIDFVGGRCYEDTCLPGYSCMGDSSMCYTEFGWDPLYELNYDSACRRWFRPDCHIIDTGDIWPLLNRYGDTPGPSGITSTCPVNNDGDNVPYYEDNCINVYNPLQEDEDGDGIGDACDIGDDIDGDGILNGDDNCPNDYNPLQEDFDSDGIGDACDPDDDGDGVPDADDACPEEDSTGFDADGDGCIDTFEGLTDVINTLEDDVLSDEIKNSLVSKVDNALKSDDKENDEAAINQLQAFINQVEAQRGNKISGEVADTLIGYANNIIEQIQAG